MRNPPQVIDLYQSCQMLLNDQYTYLNLFITVCGDIRTVVGQARLLIAQRFKQFLGLVDDCEYKRGEKETTCTDLQGFWEMIYYQVGKGGEK